MAKVKPARGKSKRPRMRPEGISCLILIVSGFVLVMFFLYFVMRNANG
jgi:hypothetical protein